MNNWQPIETAPRDGSNIILTSCGQVYAGLWLKRSDGWTAYGCADTIDYPVTHWQPLPPPPPKPKPIKYIGDGDAEPSLRNTRHHFWLCWQGEEHTAKEWVELAHKILEAEAKGWVE